MSIKLLLPAIYIVAGLIVSTFTAFMTFYIIDVPIGIKMFSKIIMSVSITLPIIALLSYFIGRYFSKKFLHINERLYRIAKEEFEITTQSDTIKEIKEIHTTLNSVSSTLERSLNTLKEKNEELSWMVRSFAHDFRTPLTIIEGNIEAIEDNLIAKDNLPTILEKIKSETHYMNELLRDVLIFIHSMKSVRKKESIYLHNFIDTDIFTLLQVPSHIKLINSIESTFVMEFNTIDLKKVLINLFENSIKFTAEGTITIYSYEDSLIIEDVGIGVKEDDIETIFKAFYTADKSKNRTYSGFGLGLAIVKNLVEKNGYEIYCDKSYKAGCKMLIKR